MLAQGRDSWFARAAPRLAGAALLLAVCLLAGARDGSAASGKPRVALKKVQVAPSSVLPGGTVVVTGKLVSRKRHASTRKIAVRLVPAPGGPIVASASTEIEVGAHAARAFTTRLQLPAAATPGRYLVSVCTRAPRCISRGLTVSSIRTSDPPINLDGDGDGLPDANDNCPNEFGLIVNGGCPAPPDGDGDGIPDSEDNCPEQPGVEAFDGCPPPTPSPGARTLGDPVFPEIGNGGYEVDHYDVALNWTLGDMFQAGTKTTVTATATQALSEFSLDFEGLTVSEVKVDGVAATFTRVAPAFCSQAPDPCAATKLVITPATPIDDNEQFAVEVAYTGNPQRHTDEDGTDEGWTDTPDGAFVVNEPIGAMTWMPCNNNPRDRAAYDFELTVPVSKTAIGNGELVGDPVINGATRTWNWVSTDTLPAYLSTATIGDFVLLEEATPGGLPLYKFMDSGFVPAGTASLLPMADIIDFYSGIYGEYPFNSAGAVVDAAPEILYALEVQTKPHFSIPVVGGVTLAHELSHQWFGDSVTVTNWNDLWHNEGWATWSEWYWDFTENGGTSPAEEFTNNYTDESEWNSAPSQRTAATLFDEFPVYIRPGMMLEALRQIIGDTNFFDLAQDWQAAHFQGHATRAGFIALVKADSGLTGADLDKLDTFFVQWLDGTTKPTITGANFFGP